MPKPRARKITEAKYDITSVHDDSNALPTCEQEAEIKQLQAEIRALVPEINRLWSLGISVAIIPLIIGPLILWKRSPFHSFYSDLYQSFYEAFNERSNLLIEKVYPIVDEAGESFRVATNKLAEIHDTVRPESTNIPFVEKVRTTLTNFDLLPPSDPLVLQAKAMLIKVFNQAVNMAASNKWKHKEMLLEMKSNEVTKRTFSQIYALVCDQIRSHEKNLMTLMTTAGVNYTVNNTADSIEKFFLKPVKVLASATLQYLVIDRALQHFFPYGIGQTAPYIVYKNANQARKVIDELTTFRNKAQGVARDNVINARLFSVLVGPLAVFLLATVENPSAGLILFAITLAATALKNVTEEIRSCNKNRKSDASLKNAQDNLEMMLANYGTLTLPKEIMASKKNRAFETSQFQVQFDYKKATRLFVGTLIQHGVNIALTRENRVILAATRIPKDAKIATEIAVTFANKLKCQEEIDQLKKQVIELLTIAFGKTAELEFFSLTSYNKLPSVIIEFNLPVSWTKYESKIREAFDPSKQYGKIKTETQQSAITLDFSDNISKICMTGNTSIEPNHFNRIKSAFRRIQAEEAALQHQKAIENATNEAEKLANELLAKKKLENSNKDLLHEHIATTQSNKIDAGDEKRSTTENTENKALHQTANTKMEEINTPKDKIDTRENARLFNISQKESEAKQLIYPIDNRGVRSYKNHFQANHYLRNGLDLEKTPDDIYNLANEALRGNLRFVAKRGAKGVVLYQAIEKGEACSVKIKFLGKTLGDFRFFAKPALNSNGKPMTGPDGKSVLHEIFHGRPKTH